MSWGRDRDPAAQLHLAPGTVGAVRLWVPSEVAWIFELSGWLLVPIVTSPVWKGKTNVSQVLPGARSRVKAPPEKQIKCQWRHVEGLPRIHPSPETVEEGNAAASSDLVGVEGCRGTTSPLGRPGLWES